MAEADILIDGMSCQHCVMRVRKALEGINGISELAVDVGRAKAVFDESRTTLEDIKAAVVKAGYKIRG